MTLVTLLAGGVGGAKLADGLQRALEPGALTVIVNVADDFELFGLRICPDLDTVMYTLAGVADPAAGWGIGGDTYRALEMLDRYGEPTWFRVGDADLATHVRRTRLLRAGGRLTDITGDLAAALGVPSRLLPATDDRLATRVLTDEGPLDFQEYFVARGQRDEVRGISVTGIEAARPSPEAEAALLEADLIVLAPSNPLVSIGPVLDLPGMRRTLAEATARVVAVSPIVAGHALRGPADRMLASLGHEATALGVARLYAGLVDRFVLDEADAALAPAVERLDMAVEVAPTVMRSTADREALARRLLAAAP